MHACQAWPDIMFAVGLGPVHVTLRDRRDCHSPSSPTCRPARIEQLTLHNNRESDHPLLWLVLLGCFTTGKLIATVRHLIFTCAPTDLVLVFALQ